MNRKIGFILIIVFGLMTILYKYYSNKMEYGYQEAESIMGRAFNGERQNKWVPIIEGNWVIHEHDSSKIFWAYSDRSVYQSEPFHLYKVINLVEGRPVSEEDAFNFESGDSLAYRLTVLHEYQNDSTLNDKAAANEFITYFKGKYPPSAYKSVNDAFVDSVLIQWRLFPGKDDR